MTQTSVEVYRRQFYSQPCPAENSHYAGCGGGRDEARGRRCDSLARLQRSPLEDISSTPVVNCCKNVQVLLEVCHSAILRRWPTADGRTHDWKIHVRSVDRFSNYSDIGEFVERIEFHLHDSFEQSRHVLKEPPFQLSETGYGTFILSVDIHLRHLASTQRIRLLYELSLDSERSISNIRYEKLVFWNPPEPFSQSLIHNGGAVFIRKPWSGSVLSTSSSGYCSNSSSCLTGGHVAQSESRFPSYLNTLLPSQIKTEVLDETEHASTPEIHETTSSFHKFAPLEEGPPDSAAEAKSSKRNFLQHWLRTVTGAHEESSSAESFRKPRKGQPSKYVAQSSTKVTTSPNADSLPLAKSVPNLLVPTSKTICVAESNQITEAVVTEKTPRRDTGKMKRVGRPKKRPSSSELPARRPKKRLSSGELPARRQLKAVKRSRCSTHRPVKYVPSQRNPPTHQGSHSTKVLGHQGSQSTMRDVEPNTSDSVPSSSPRVVKRPRGRPRTMTSPPATRHCSEATVDANKRDVTTVSDDDSDVIMVGYTAPLSSEMTSRVKLSSQTVNEYSSSLVKRKRGRPRKKPLPVDPGTIVYRPEVKRRRVDDDEYRVTRSPNRKSQRNDVTSRKTRKMTASESQAAFHSLRSSTMSTLPCYRDDSTSSLEEFWEDDRQLVLPQKQRQSRDQGRKHSTLQLSFSSIEDNESTVKQRTRGRPRKSKVVKVTEMTSTPRTRRRRSPDDVHVVRKTSVIDSDRSRWINTDPKKVAKKSQDSAKTSDLGLAKSTTGKVGLSRSASPVILAVDQRRSETSRRADYDGGCGKRTVLRGLGDQTHTITRDARQLRLCDDGRQQTGSGEEVRHYRTDFDTLVEIQRRLALTSERSVLKKVVEIIELSGNYRLDDLAFDFDLCSLEPETITKLRHCLRV